jgi:Tfp pilus assembly protein PilF
MKLLLLLCISLIITLSAAAQYYNLCLVHLDESKLKYRERNYKAALKLFNKAARKPCVHSATDFYTGACIASMAKSKKSALKYLKLSIDKGFDDTLQMKKDTCLDHIRSSEQYQVFLKTEVHHVKK